MKSRGGIILAGMLAILLLGAGCSKTSNEAGNEAGEEKGGDNYKINEGTSFQGHQEGNYGPVGSGGYGSPVPMKEEEAKPDRSYKINEGTSLQGHQEGRYGPVGSGGYGSPVPLEEHK